MTLRHGLLYRIISNQPIAERQERQMNINIADRAAGLLWAWLLFGAIIAIIACIAIRKPLRRSWNKDDTFKKRR